MLKFNQGNLQDSYMDSPKIARIGFIGADGGQLIICQCYLFVVMLNLPAFAG